MPRMNTILLSYLSTAANIMQLPDFQVCDRDLSDNILSQYLTSEAVAIDTETMGLLPTRDRLCLVQICDA